MSLKINEKFTRINSFTQSNFAFQQDLLVIYSQNAEVSQYYRKVKPFPFYFPPFSFLQIAHPKFRLIFR